MQVFLTGENAENASRLLDILSQAVERHQSADFKAFVLLRKGDPAEGRLKLPAAENVGVAVLADEEPLKLYKINTKPAVRNTIVLYRDRKVRESFVNLDPVKDRARLEEAIRRLCAEK